MAKKRRKTRVHDANSEAVGSGKYKGRTLSSLTNQEVHLLWAGWNGVPRLKLLPFFQKIVAEKHAREFKEKQRQEAFKAAKQRAIASQKKEPQQTTLPEGSIPHGKHAGRMPRSLNDVELQQTILSWNGSAKLKQDAFFVVLQTERQRRYEVATKDNTEPVSLYFMTCGPHRGSRLSDIPHDELEEYLRDPFYRFVHSQIRAFLVASSAVNV